MRLENKNLYLVQVYRLIMKYKSKLINYLNELVLKQHHLLNIHVNIKDKSNKKMLRKFQDKINKVSQQLNQL